jgi:HIP---CoA ligase
MHDTDKIAWQSIPHLLDDCVTRYADTLAIVDGPLRISYRDLKAHVVAAARGLLAQNVAPGDRIAIWAPNDWQWIVAALATQSIGAAIVPLNTRFRSGEISYILKKAAPKLIFIRRHFLDTDYVALLDEAAIDGPRIGAVTFDNSEQGFGLTWSDLLAAGEGVSAETVSERVSQIGPDTVSDIMFTSGTTGYPRGVPGLHGQAIRAFHRFGLDGGFRIGERHAVVNPFFHALGYKLGWLLSMMFGATTYPLETFDPAEMLRLVAEERITVLPGPPTIYQALLARPEREELDLSSLRICVTGTTTLPASLIDRIRREFGFEIMLTGYGLTECTALATMTRPGDDVRTVVETSGRAVPDVEVAVFDEDGANLPAGAIGEIRVRGYNVMDGYFNDPQATAETITSDGWLKTGDLGSFDESGNLRIEGRLKDMYIVGGFNTYPAEIENTLMGHPDIAEVAVIGIPDERLGEVGMAFVVPSTQTHASDEDIKVWVRPLLANFKLPRVIEFVDALPKNASGKVLKTRLREAALQFGPNKKETTT